MGKFFGSFVSGKADGSLATKFFVVSHATTDPKSCVDGSKFLGVVCRVKTYFDLNAPSIVSSNKEPGFYYEKSYIKSGSLYIRVSN